MSALSLRSGNVNLYKFNQWSVADLMPFRIRQRVRGLTCAHKRVAIRRESLAMCRMV